MGEVVRCCACDVELHLVLNGSDENLQLALYTDHTSRPVPCACSRTGTSLAPMPDVAADHVISTDSSQMRAPSTLWPVPVCMSSVDKIMPLGRIQEEVGVVRDDNERKTL